MAIAGNDAYFVLRAEYHWHPLVDAGGLKIHDTFAPDNGGTGLLGDKVDRIVPIHTVLVKLPTSLQGLT